MTLAGPILLTPLDLAIASALLLVAGGLSFAHGLKLEAGLGLAAVRMVVQLALVALVLKFLLETTSALWTALAAAVMIGAAGLEAVSRQSGGAAAGRLRWPLAGLATATLLVVGLVSTAYVIGAVIRPMPVLSPRYVLPILGMVLGNALTAVSLVMAEMVQRAEREKARIEARLALGATIGDAMAEVTRGAMRTGLVPIVNAMAATGLVTIPGMMSGQVLAGVDPIEAAKYQIVVMVTLAGATALAAMGAAYGCRMLLTDGRHRLRLDRLAATEM